TVLDPALVHHPHEPNLERTYLNPPQIALLGALADGSALALDPVPPLSAGAHDLLAAYQSQAATLRAHQRALSWLDELDAIVSAILDSRSWKIGRAITGAMGWFRRRPRISAPERRDRLMAELRHWRRGDAGE
ncbi:MAG TPA: hypothetical protein VKM72_26685, partial [Thermoanaerobaculia bacterium]|nr:hypothetical protein [Thermoanaerobaculia bacterium]